MKYTFGNVVSDVRSRKNVSIITTAESYLADLATIYGKSQAARSFCDASEFRKASQFARKRLTAYQDGMDIDTKSFDQSSKIAAGAYAEYEAIVSTIDKDHDGDIVHPDGITFDAKAPALWMHAMGMPIGGLKEVVSQDATKAICRFKVADTQLGRDAIKLMQVNALRKSIGFKPVEFSPVSMVKGKDGSDVVSGWDIKKANVLEVSAVSIPANANAHILQVFEKSVDGIRTLYGRDELEHEVTKGWAKSIYDKRAVAVAGWSPEPVVNAIDKLADIAQKQMEIMQKTVAEPKTEKRINVDTLCEKVFGMDENIAGSYESRIEKVSKAACKAVCKEKDIERYGSKSCYPVATFEDSVVVCVWDWSDSDKKACYSVGYTMGTDGDVTIGDMQEVKIEASITPKLHDVLVAKGFATKDASGKLIQKQATPVVVAEQSVKQLLQKAFAKATVDGIDESVLQFAENETKSLKELHEAKQLQSLFGCEIR